MNKIDKYTEYIGRRIGTGIIIKIEHKKCLIKCDCGNISERNFFSMVNKKNQFKCNKCINGKLTDDYIGKTIGKLTILDISKKSNNKVDWIAHCKCECGNVFERPLLQITRKAIKEPYCGKCYRGIKYTDYIGRKIGYLTILELLTINNKSYFKCKCDCGNYKTLRINTLLSGNTKSCGNCKSIYLDHKENNSSYIETKDKNEYIGKKYGNLTIQKIFKTGFGNRTRTIKYTAICKCDCGEVIEKDFAKLTKNIKSFANKNCGKCFKGIKYSDYIGKKYGHLIIRDFSKTNKSGVYFDCQCDCGNIVTKQLSYLIRAKSSSISCGKCLSNYDLAHKITGLKDGITKKDIIGKTVGYLTIKDFFYGATNNKKNSAKIKAVCRCGQEKIYRFEQLQVLKSCGCLIRKIKATKNISFGRLKVLKISDNTIGGLRYICKCDCGNEIEVLESDLFTGKVTCCEECNAEC